MAREDSADRHVARWRNHWIDVPFDDKIEAAVVRIGLLKRYLGNVTKAAVAENGLQDFEYDTLHTLMIRDTPGQASPTALADDMGVSAAGMTGRLDGLEKAGYVQRVPGVEDRRRVHVEITKEGAAIWRKAMRLRAAAEEAMVGVLSPREQATLNRLLKKMMLYVEDDDQRARTTRPSSHTGPSDS
ncbi:MAG: MarR family transcriptional regulator [Marmoricola sp.]|jgi:DNA-binding MarR family transcriptional regulator|nr:MarR family transcriptional regulator [Marmoricola sp.]